MKQYRPKSFLGESTQYYCFIPVSGGQASISGNNSFFCHQFFSKGLFTWREEDPSTRKIREGGKTFRLLYMQKFRPKWLPSGEGKEE